MKRTTLLSTVACLCVLLAGCNANRAMEEFLNWTLFQGLVIVGLVFGFHFVTKVLKDIRDTLNKILGHMRGHHDL